MASEYKKGVTQSVLRSMLDYDKDTGIFIWKVYRGHLAKVGDIAGARDKGGYVGIYIHNSKYLAHRLAWLYVYGEFPSGNIDHIDGNPNNNSIYNLRDVTQNQNLYNTKRYATNTSGFKGVTYHKALSKWRAYIRYKGKQIHLGYYDTPEDASEFYELVAVTLRGAYHRAHK